MGIIFISHSSRNNNQAIRVRDWLREHGGGETFLDLDPAHGLAPGQRWQEELKKAGERCSAVVVLISPDWVASRWCQVEFLLAAQLGKQIFPITIAPTPLARLPIELTANYQLVIRRRDRRSGTAEHAARVACPGMARLYPVDAAGRRHGRPTQEASGGYGRAANWGAAP